MGEEKKKLKMGRTRVEVCRGEWQDVMCCVDEEKKSCWVGMGSYLWKLSFLGRGQVQPGERSEELAAGEQGQ